MKLFKYENYEVTISEEALLLEPFLKVWKRDKSKSKTKALLELAFIYFMYDPRSDYMFVSDELRRFKEIKLQAGMDARWKPDSVLNEAIELYKYLTTTSASVLVLTTRVAIDKLAEQLNNIDYSARTNSGGLLYPLNMITSTIEKIPTLVKRIIEAEKLMNQQIEESAKMRGSGTKKILEDGL